MADEKDHRFPDVNAQPLLGWKPKGDDEPIEPMPAGFAPVRFLPGQHNPPPAIRWGDFFDLTHKDCKPLAWQLERVKKVAAAMNHAAAHAQDMLRQTIEIAVHQEDLLHQHVANNIKTDEVVQSMTESVNAEANARTHEILELRRMLRETRAEAVEYALTAVKHGAKIDPLAKMSWGGKTFGERLAEDFQEATA